MMTPERVCEDCRESLDACLCMIDSDDSVYDIEQMAASISAEEMS